MKTEVEQEYKHWFRQIHRQTGRQKCRLAGRQTEVEQGYTHWLRQKNRQTGRLAC